MESRPLVLVRGTGDVGSAVAAILFRAGFGVALHDTPAPAASRRGMAFVDAVFDGVATLDGLIARRVGTVSELDAALRDRVFVPVAVWPLPDILAASPWAAIVDARMRKRTVAEAQRHLAPLTIGLGPGFVAGGNVDLAVETGWGDALGTVVEEGPTRALAGEPRAIGGIGRARFVYAPIAGRFHTSARIGEPVVQGQLLATIGQSVLAAPIAGVLRGLTRDDVDVAVGAKVIEVDPRGDPALVVGLGERPRRIAEGALAALGRLRVIAPAP